MTWVSFERAAKFLAAVGWANWEIIGRPVMLQQDPNMGTLIFIASVLGVSEAVRAIKTFDKEEVK